MGKAICHHEGMFFEWSTVVDAPVTYGMTREAFEAYYRDEYGRASFEDELPGRMKRVLTKGTSFLGPTTLDSLLEFNAECAKGGPIDDYRPTNYEELMKVLTPPPHS